MTTPQHDQFRQLYLELNQDHADQRELLMQCLQSNVVSLASSNVAQPARRISRRWLLGSGGMAAAVLVAGLFLWPPQDALAEIQEALRAQEWIHLVVKRLDGSQAESWESPGGQIRASKWPEEVRFLDKSNSIEQVYDVAQKKLIRMEPDESQHPDTMQTLIDVLLGDANSTNWLKVAKRQQRTVTEDGKTWDEVTLTSEPMGGQVTTWICKIDPETHLPISYRTHLPTTGNFEPGWVEGKFDYPPKGPLSITELGVPADAELDDRVPKDSLKHIFASMKRARETLGPYHLKLFYNIGPQLCRECWKDGFKWRQDHEVPEICDGKQLWVKTLSGWELQESRQLNPGWPYIEDMTYPQLTATMDFELKLHSDPTDGPEGCILVEKVATANANQFVVDRFVPRREQFWLDPDRDYALVKHVRTDVQASEAECRSRQCSKHQEFHYSHFEQSPKGVWYPTRIESIGTEVPRENDPLASVPKAILWTIEVEFAESYPSKLFDIDAAKKRLP